MAQQINKILCPQCKAECDVNAKFCMCCGTNIQVNNSKSVTSDNVKQSSSQSPKPAKKKSKTIVIIIVICIAVALLLCVGAIVLINIVKKFLNDNETTNNEATNNTVSLVSKEQIKDKIITDNFSSDSKVTDEIKEEIDIVVEDVKSNSVVITVESPDISVELLEWLNEQEDYTDKEFEDKIIELVENSEKEINKYELQCSDNAAEIMYTQECKNSMNCGLTEFYFMCMEQVIEEMKAGE